MVLKLPFQLDLSLKMFVMHMYTYRILTLLQVKILIEISFFFTCELSNLSSFYRSYYRIVESFKSPVYGDAG